MCRKYSTFTPVFFTHKHTHTHTRELCILFCQKQFLPYLFALKIIFQCNFYLHKHFIFFLVSSGCFLWLLYCRKPQRIMSSPLILLPLAPSRTNRAQYPIYLPAFFILMHPVISGLDREDRVPSSETAHSIMLLSNWQLLK